jgi:hypothetical protein
MQIKDTVNLKILTIEKINTGSEICGTITNGANIHVIGNAKGEEKESRTGEAFKVIMAENSKSSRNSQ